MSGHTLRNEGGAFDALGHRLHGGKVGRGKCSCGALSEMLFSRNARKRWHREHKTEVLAVEAQDEAERRAMERRWAEAEKARGAEGSLRFVATGSLPTDGTLEPFISAHSLVIEYRDGGIATLVVHGFDGISRLYEIEKAAIDITAWPAYRGSD